MTEKKQPISVQQLQELAKGRLIEIPNWEGDDTIVVRIKSIDLTPHLMEIDKLPNELMIAAKKVFEAGTQDEKAEAAVDLMTDKDKKKHIKDLIPLMETMAKEALVEPTYEEFEKTMPLTVPMKSAIFAEVMGGVKKLKSFRKQP